MSWRITEIRKKVLFIESDTPYEIASMFMRPQEFYESTFPNIHNKFFTIEEFMDTYSKKSGEFTYFEDWGGFNIPSNKLRLFFNTFTYDLTRKENLLYNMINSIIPNLEGEFYVIGTSKGHFNKVTIKHEIAHAYYYLHEHYVTFVDELLNKMKPSLYASAKESLNVNFGYNAQVTDDEIQAYLATETNREHIMDLFGWSKNVKIPSTFRSFFKEFDSSHK